MRRCRRQLGKDDRRSFWTHDTVPSKIWLSGRDKGSAVKNRKETSACGPRCHGDLREASDRGDLARPAKSGPHILVPQIRKSIDKQATYLMGCKLEG